MRKHYVLVDGNSIGHANHNASELSVGGFPVQAIFGFIKSLKKAAESLSGDLEFIVLWDGKADFRFELHPEYKGNRAPLDAKQAQHKENYQRQLPVLEKALELLGIKQLRSPTHEADDLGYTLAKNLSVNHRVTLMTGDKDWYQDLFNDNVTVLDPIRERKITLANLFEHTGCRSVAEYVQCKALQGDSSDNCSGIPGIGEKTAALFIAQWGDVRKFFAEVDAGTYKPATRKSKNATSLHPEQVLASPEGRAIFERNMKLMDLSQARPLDKLQLVVKAKPGNPEGFIALCERLAFASILRERHSYFRAFNLAAPVLEAA